MCLKRALQTIAGVMGLGCCLDDVGQDDESDRPSERDNQEEGILSPVDEAGEEALSESDDREEPVALTGVVACERCNQD